MWYAYSRGAATRFPWDERTSAVRGPAIRHRQGHAGCHRAPARRQSPERPAMVSRVAPGRPSGVAGHGTRGAQAQTRAPPAPADRCGLAPGAARVRLRSEEHTSELQSRLHLVCRLLLEKKKKKTNDIIIKNEKKNKNKK